MDIARTSRRRNRTPHVVIAATVIAVAAVTLLSTRLRSAGPTVDRGTLWIDTVKRGDMLRQVRASGILEIEGVRLVTAAAPARLQSIEVRPGALVTADTVLMRLGNPDLELQALEAERQLSAGEAELANLEATVHSQSLQQQSSVKNLLSDLRQAQRRANADDDLAKRGYLSKLEMEQSVEHVQSLSSSIEFERARLQAQGRGDRARVTAQRAQLQRLRSIAEFRRREVEALVVRAGSDGVLQELPLQLGQWIPAGTVLAKVGRPDTLKATLRVPETQARDIQVGQVATIDTHNGLARGSVARIDPAVRGGSVAVEVTFAKALPKGARPDLSIEGTIDLERLHDVAYMSRPAVAQMGSEVTVFRLSANGGEATRQAVRLGRSSFATVEILDGLSPGDRVILSDLSAWDGAQRLHLQ